ncbi:inactive carboxypeptidase-like protein X2 [Acanthaster planci]|uniref:Inactive carboxypeptidase-like protein X2 n=1 Tax=Acanthaster planci TaxID=133434 RepID=A0A8B7YVR6_ACAPL|nr:inactive carboxypeptidase-like protein X2 [Acanthaster planci]
MMANRQWTAIIDLLTMVEIFLATCCMCGTISTIFRATEGRTLIGHTFMEISGISAVKCVVLCLSYHHECRSISYDHMNAVCRINNASKEEFMTTFHPEPNYTFYESDNSSQLARNCLSYGSSPHPEPISSSKTVCDCSTSQAMGMESGQIPDNKISVSSVRDGFFANNTRLTNGGWCAAEDDPHPWVQVDLDTQACITKIKCGPRTDLTRYIDTYKVLYSDDGVNFNTLQNGTMDILFDGPRTARSWAEATLPTAVSARFIRLLIVNTEQSRKIDACFKFELYGCRN